LAFGPDSWENLKTIYMRMVNGKEFKVRKSLASSIQEIANILGSEITEKELIPIMDKLYKEEGEIQNIMMKNTPKFLKSLKKDSRKQYLDRLKKMLNPREKWRVKKEYSKVIGHYDFVYDDEITYKQILPISLHFCLDDVKQIYIIALF
jgi:serine/threonine-protein phosphatase 4 regulatory subunit 1